MNDSKIRTLAVKLSSVYGNDSAWLADQIREVVDDFSAKLRPEAKIALEKPYRLTQADMALITYANSIETKSAQKTPLATLLDFLSRYDINKALPIVHILPFYPWDTDRGFSVADYYQVNPSYGTWNDIDQLGQITKLMFDFVANHASIENPLVQGSLIEKHISKDDPRYSDVASYKNFVITYLEDTKPSDDRLASLSRPRPHPVLTRYSVVEIGGKIRALLGAPPTDADTIFGQGWAWTTFSRPQNEDGSEKTRQVDLNYANPRVFLEVIKILLFYVRQGSRIIRLDAIGYIWKKLDSQSLHEPQAHLLLEVMDELLSWAVPGVISIAEINEPQDMVFEYLGTHDHQEADLIYQFTHFPLAVHAVLTENSSYYKKWLPTTNKFEGRQFTTVLGSHDGMGLKPVRGLLPDSEIDKLTKVLEKEFKALPNLARLPGGKEIVYEICATPWNLINKPLSKEPIPAQIDKFLAVLNLGLIPRGIPAIYLNGLFGAENYLPQEGLDENRTVNRETFKSDKLYSLLDDENSQMGQVFRRVIEILKKRAQEPAFEPNGQPLQVVDCANKSTISVLLESQNKKDKVIVVVNISNKQQSISLLALSPSCVDLLSEESFKPTDNFLSLDLRPYQTRWLKAIE